MTLWRRCSRRRPRRSVPQAVASSWSARLALVTLVLGLVLMHHVVGVHSHSMPDVSGQVGIAVEHSPETGAGAPSGTPPVTGSASSTHHLDQHDRAARDADGIVAPRTEAVGSAPVALGAVPAAASRGDDEGAGRGIAVLLHLCLAIVVGLTLLVLMALVERWWRSVTGHETPAGAAATRDSRAPPVPLRLAQLQVLRL